MKIVTLSELKRLAANLPSGNVAKSSNKISGNNMIYWKNAYSIQLKIGNNIIHVPLVENLYEGYNSTKSHLVAYKDSESKIHSSI